MTSGKDKWPSKAALETGRPFVILFLFLAVRNPKNGSLESRIANSQIQGTIHFDVSELAPGIYALNLQSDAFDTQVKFIKSKSVQA